MKCLEGVKMKEKTKVIVTGLDGATWDLIKPWTDTHFGKLMGEGAEEMLSSLAGIRVLRR
jgi:predicted AlkP superfamily phosphohydrolase/phosphomutase